MTKTRSIRFSKRRRRGGRKTVKRRGGRRRSRVTKRRGGRRRSRVSKRRGGRRRSRVTKRGGWECCKYATDKAEVCTESVDGTYPDDYMPSRLRGKKRTCANSPLHGGGRRSRVRRGRGVSIPPECLTWAFCNNHQGEGDKCHGVDCQNLPLPTTTVPTTTMCPNHGKGLTCYQYEGATTPIPGPWLTCPNQSTGEGGVACQP